MHPGQAYRSGARYHDFNMPLQLGGEGGDLPSDAQSKRCAFLPRPPTAALPTLHASTSSGVLHAPAL